MAKKTPPTDMAEPPLMGVIGAVHIRAVNPIGSDSAQLQTRKKGRGNIIFVSHETPWNREVGQNAVRKSNIGGAAYRRAGNEKSQSLASTL